MQRTTEKRLEEANARWDEERTKSQKADRAIKVSVVIYPSVSYININVMTKIAYFLMFRHMGNIVAIFCKAM